MGGGQRTCDARSEPARSTMKSLPTRTSSSESALRLRRRTVTCSTAWEREDVLLAAVGSCVRCRLPLVRSCMI